MRTFSTVFWISLTSAALITGCTRQRTVHGSASLTVAGREIKATIDVPAGTYPNIDPATILTSDKGGAMGGPIAIYPEGDAASIRFGTHQIRVEKERLLLDGKEAAKVAPGVRQVELVLSNTSLTVTADGACLQVRALVRAAIAHLSVGPNDERRG